MICNVYIINHIAFSHGMTSLYLFALSSMKPAYSSDYTLPGQSEGGNPLCDATAFDGLRRPLKRKF